jgi:hypothetical protein
LSFFNSLPFMAIWIFNFHFSIFNIQSLIFNPQSSFVVISILPPSLQL